MELIVESNEVKDWGVDCAIMLAILYAEENEAARKSKLDEDGYFELTIDHVFDFYGIPEKRQRKAINFLKQAHLVQTKLKGLPKKRCIKL